MVNETWLTQPCHRHLRQYTWDCCIAGRLRTAVRAQSRCWDSENQLSLRRHSYCVSSLLLLASVGWLLRGTFIRFYCVWLSLSLRSTLTRFIQQKHSTLIYIYICVSDCLSIRIRSQCTMHDISISIEIQ